MHSGVACPCGDEYHSEPQASGSLTAYNSCCLVDRGVPHALLKRANKPETAVQRSALLFRLEPHGLLHHV